MTTYALIAGKGWVPSTAETRRKAMQSFARQPFRTNIQRVEYASNVERVRLELDVPVPRVIQHAFKVLRAIGRSLNNEIGAAAWDPYHGDLNNRHPRLGQQQKRIGPKEQWTDFRLTQPATYNNGIFADYSPLLDVASRLDVTRAAFGRESEPELRSAA